MPLKLPFELEFRTDSEKENIAYLQTIAHITADTYVYGHLFPKNNFRLLEEGTVIRDKYDYPPSNWKRIGRSKSPANAFLIGNPYAFKYGLA